MPWPKWLPPATLLSSLRRTGNWKANTVSNQLPWSLSAPWTAMLASFFPTSVGGFPAVLMMTERLSFCFSVFQFYCFGLIMFGYMMALCWTTARSSSLSSIFYFWFFFSPSFYEGFKIIIIIIIIIIILGQCLWCCHCYKYASRLNWRNWF